MEGGGGRRRKVRIRRKNPSSVFRIIIEMMNREKKEEEEEEEIVHRISLLLHHHHLRHCLYLVSRKTALPKEKSRPLLFRKGGGSRSSGFSLKAVVVVVERRVEIPKKRMILPHSLFLPLLPLVPALKRRRRRRRKKRRKKLLSPPMLEKRELKLEIRLR